MTIAEAIGAVRLVGSMEVAGGKIRIRFPESRRDAIRPALDALRTGKAEALMLLAESERAEMERASGILSAAGVRLMELDGCMSVGVWSDLDGPEVRAALAVFGSGRLPVRYLDGAGVPMRYKARRVKGEPVPMAVLAEMERHAVEPWKVRDRMLNEMGWRSKGSVSSCVKPTLR